MPTYKITDPTTRKTLRITGDSPPTQQELEEVFSQASGLAQPEETVGILGKVPVSGFEEGERNIAGNIFERPAAAIRGGILARKAGESVVGGFGKGTIDPSQIPTFQETGAKEASRISGKLPRPLARTAGFVGSIGAQSIGALADVATNPADVLLSILFETAPVQKGIGLLGKTKPAQALGRFATKERHLPGRGLLKKGQRALKKFKGQPKAPIKETITEQIQVTKQARTQALNRATTQTEKSLLNSANKIDDEVLKMTDDLQRSAETGSLEFQKRIPKAQRAASNEYGRRLDTISDDLVKRGETITKGDMNNALSSTKQELRELELPIGRAENVIDKLSAEKYGTAQFSKNFTLQEVLTDTKLIKGQGSSGLKLGTRPFSDDEVAIAIFNKNFGKLLEQKAPALIDLNKSYAPVMRVNKASHRLFKPRAGELQTKAGTGLLKKASAKKVVKGKISPAPTIERGERELIRILEEGTEFGKGVGKISEPTKRIGERIAGREVAKVKAKGLITKRGAAEQQRIANQFDKRLRQLATREKKVEQLLRNKAKINKIKTLVAGGTITIAGAITAIKSFLGLKRSFGDN